MKAKDIMITKVHTVEPKESLMKVASLIVLHGIAGVPVASSENELVGIISEKDILKAVYPSAVEFQEEPLTHMDFEEMEKRYCDVGRSTAEDIMTRNVITATSETPVLELASLMIRKRVRRLPVVDGNKLIGIVSLGDVHRALFRDCFNL